MKRFLTGTLMVGLALMPVLGGVGWVGWIVLLVWWLSRGPSRKAAKRCESMVCGESEPEAEPATYRQLRYLERLASEAGATLPEQEPTKHEASEAIDFLLVRLGRKSERTTPDWRAWIDRTDVLIVDTETTGLGTRAEVIEVAVLDTTGTVRYEALILPEGRIPAEASSIHGLTRKRLEAEGARPWPEVHDELAAVLDGAAVVLAWNADFDRRLLAQTADRHGLSMPSVLWHDLIGDYRTITDEAPRKGRHTLAAVVNRTGAKVDGPAHRAAGDCRAVLAVMGRWSHSDIRSGTRQPARGSEGESKGKAPHGRVPVTFRKRLSSQPCCFPPAARSISTVR